jgi:CheY-like chemotaxis protein
VAKILSMHAETEILRLLHLILVRAGYEHLHTTDPNTALAILRDEHIDLFIQNLMRPEINGCEFYQMMQNDDKLRDIPVLIVSALNPILIPETYFNMINSLYPNNYLLMPFSPHVLVKTVQRILSE